MGFVNRTSFETWEANTFAPHCTYSNYLPQIHHLMLPLSYRLHLLQNEY
nr:MAG TPA: hypothetical protein [Bacteriophage sp.]